MPAKRPWLDDRAALPPSKRVSSSEARVSSNEEPVSSSEEPVSSSEAPVSSSEAPVSSSEAPVFSSEARVSSSEAQDSPTSSPHFNSVTAPQLQPSAMPSSHSQAQSPSSQTKHNTIGQSAAQPSNGTALNDQEETTRQTRRDFALAFLLNMSFAERMDLYKRHWDGVTVALEDLQPPKVCAGLPTLADELFKAYLTYVRVVVKVLVNYDCVKELFYLDLPRLSTCGELRISPQARTRLERFDWATFKMHNVQVIIGTYGHSLYCFNVKYHGYPRHSLTWLPDCSRTHALLQLPLGDAAKFVDEDLRAAAKGGLVPEDLDQFAKHFRFLPRHKIMENACFSH